MPDRVLCSKCHGQRTIVCAACHGSGKRSVAGVAIDNNCEQCRGSGQERCDVCGGIGETEPTTE